jgi:sugar phosphate isomerase/epimerase
MQLGIFAKTFARARFDQVLDAVASHGLRVVHFNFNSVGLPTLPDTVSPSLTTRIRADCAARDISIAGVSGTFNMINPDVQALRNHLTRLPALAAATREIGCELITLCTGTRDPEDMWRAHPENSASHSWRELLRSMEEAIGIADQHDILLGIEPETGNVVSSVRKARQLLDELQTRRVRIVLDPANFFCRGDVERVRERIEEAFQLLGTDIVMAHAKELAPDGSVGTIPPGRGILDWNYYLDTLARMDFSGAIVMHGLSEADVPQATRFLRSKIPE